MQYILTQQEYDKLVARSDETSKQIDSILRSDNIKLRAELVELHYKYTRLLVSTNNEKLKGH